MDRRKFDQGAFRTTSGSSPSFGRFFAMIKMKSAGASLPRLRVQASSTLLSWPPHRRHAPGRGVSTVAKATFGKGRFISQGQCVGMEKNTGVAAAA
jgi:hypothetical protein